MNDSDMEVDEELPNLSVNIEREKFEKLTKKQIKQQEVINKLIHTEQKHVRNLKIMKHHFYIPVKVEYLLSEDERNLLFPNLDEILDLHSTFNNRLKKLRKENPIVSIDQLITILQDEFQNENGQRFQSACASFCQNQSEAMKFLQTKSKLLADKFTLFLAKSENDSICRKLHLKDFLPTEVQRLVKYRLLFQELSKNVPDYNDDIDSDDCDNNNINNKKRLADCIEASTKISLYVNKAVTECENRKRVIEIQSKLDTKEFDQYCNKSHVLMPYRNLQLVNRRLVYEGELEWKLSNLKLMALLFEDILVFLETTTLRHDSDKSASDLESKRRYVLRPLIYIIGKAKQMFTPVIPLSCINSFRSMHDKRSFHLVAIIEDSIKMSTQTSTTSSGTYSSSSSSSSTGSANKPLSSTFQSSTSNTKPIQAQMLFILIAKSGDERNKWTSHLQELTGKMMQSVGNDVHNSNVQDLTTSSKTSTISASNLLSSNNNSNNKNNAINSISSSALISSNNNNNNKNKEFLNLDPTTPSSSNKEQDLTSQLETNTNEILNLLKVRQDLLFKLLKLNPISSSSTDSTTSDSNNSKVIVQNSIGLVNKMTTMLLTDSNISQQAKSLQIIIKLEEYLKKLNQNITTNETVTTVAKLPDLSSTMKKPSIVISTSNNNNRITMNELNNNNNNNNNDFIAADAVSTTTTTSELTADLSEDEQINYYDDYDYNSSNDNINNNNENNDSKSIETPLIDNTTTNRRISDCSNTTLAAKNNKKKSNISEDADDEEDDNYKNMIQINSENNNNNNNNNDLGLEADDNGGSGMTEMKKCFRSSNEILKSLVTSPPPVSSLPSPSSNNNNNNNNSKKTNLNDDANDLSDDEVKDYLTLKDNFDEISHV